MMREAPKVGAVVEVSKFVEPALLWEIAGIVGYAGDDEWRVEIKPSAPDDSPFRKQATVERERWPASAMNPRWIVVDPTRARIQEGK